MRLPALDIVTGALLIGTWAGTSLYMVELIQVFYYFCHFKDDDWKLKTLVTVAFLIDTIGALANYACVYLYTITHAGDPLFLATQPWLVPLDMCAIAIVAALVQSFLVLRYWKFTQNKVITTILVFLIIVTFGSSLATGLVIALDPSFKSRAKVKVAAVMWDVTEVVADVCIAAALLWEFRKAKSALIDLETRRMGNTLNRLVVVTIETGMGSALTTVAILVAYLTNNQSNVPIGISYSLGHIYIICMLLNLNIRQPDYSFSTKGMSGGPGSNGELATQSVVFAAGGTQGDISGIHVHRTVSTSILHIESRPDFHAGTLRSSSARSLANDNSARRK
ncbi:hypothetical protein MVEN_00279000 [Mycena venus]|uniref:DUF6534 domain-containing protein n=1 Tax=Mycena venus TaxID=2733690 RepID=A0A8H7DES3_9AGAR|nr:hypothetical protein MVEN_00279000 [Mycena venus]